MDVSHIANMSVNDKDDYQAAILEKMCNHPEISESMKSQIESVLRSTGKIQDEPKSLIRQKRRKRNYVLAKISIELGLFDRPLNLPYELMIEPTSFCNLKCPLCPTGNGTMNRKAGRMEMSHFKNLVDHVEDEVRRIVFWGFGEPFINKESTKMIRYASDKKIHVITSTNGTLLNNPVLAKEIVESGLYTLYVALDGLTQETLSAYRVGADLKDILAGVQLIRDFREKSGAMKPELILQFVVTKENQHELEKAETFFRAAGFDKVSVKYANVMATTDTPDFDKLAEQFIPSEEKGSRFKRTDNGKLRVKGNIYNKCYKLFTQTMINWNGDVVPCCWDVQSDYILGNVFESSLQDIWFNDAYKKFRKTVYSNRSEYQICCDCPTDRTENKLSRQFSTRRLSRTAEKYEADV